MTTLRTILVSFLGIFFFIQANAYTVTVDFEIDQGYSLALNEEITFTNNSKSDPLAGMTYSWRLDGVEFSKKFKPDKITIDKYGNHEIEVHAYIGNDSGELTKQFTVRSGGWIFDKFFPIEGMQAMIGFTAGNNVYFGLGNSEGRNYNQFWKYNTEENYWKIDNTFPDTPRTSMVSFTINGEGYVGLGEHNGYYSKKIWKFNANTGSWFAIADFPGNGRRKANVLVINNKAYVGAGFDNSGVLTDFWEYNPSTNSWKQVASYTYGNGNKHGFVAGNRGFIAESTTLYEYVPSTDTWVEKQAMPPYFANTGEIRAAFNGEKEGYVLRFNFGFGFSLFSYDPSTDSWQTEEMLSKEKSEYFSQGWGYSTYDGMGYLCNEKGRLYKFNPEHKGVLAQFDIGNPHPSGYYRVIVGEKRAFGYQIHANSSNFNVEHKWLVDGIEVSAKDSTWTGFPNIEFNQVGVFEVSLVELADTISDTAKIVVQVVPDYCRGSWKELARMPGAGRSDGVSFIIDSFAYAGLGGDKTSFPTYYKDFYKYDINKNKWTKVADFPGSAREHPVSFVINGYGYVGMGHPRRAVSVDTLEFDFYKYDPVNDNWTQVASFPGTPSIRNVVKVINNKAYVFCGEKWQGFSHSKSNEVWQYNPVNDEWIQMNDFPGFANSDPQLLEHGGYTYLRQGNTDVILSGNKFTPKLWRYDHINDTWEDGRLTADQLPSTGVNIVTSDFYLDSMYMYMSAQLRTHKVQGYNEADQEWKYYVNPYSNDQIDERYFMSSALKWFSYKNKAYIIGMDDPSLPSYNKLMMFNLDSCMLPFSTILQPGTNQPIEDTIFKCLEDTKTIFLTSGSKKNDASYKWYKNGVPISGANFYFYFANQAANYSLTMYHSEDSFISQIVTIANYPAPLKPIIIKEVDTLYTSTADSIQWYYNGTSITGANDTVHIASNLGIFEVEHFNEYGCKTKSDTVFHIPSSYVKIIDSLTNQVIVDTVTICENDSIKLLAGTNNQAVNFRWTLNNIPIVTDNNYLYAKDTGNYQLTIYYGSDSLVSQIVTLSNYPTPTKPKITLGDTLYTTNADSIQWYFNEEPIIGANDSFYVVMDSGVYEVQHFNIYGCSNISDTVHAKPVLSSILDVLEEGKKIMVYPNPFNNQIVIKLETSIIKQAHVKVLSSSGKLVFDNEVVLDNGMADIDLSGRHIANGVYFVQVWIEGRVFNFKLAKQ